MTDGEIDDWTEAETEWFAPLIPSNGAASWNSFPAVADLFPWQQPGCQFGRTAPVAPSVGVLKERWLRFVSTTDAADRAICFNASKTGRNINTKVAGRVPLAGEPINASPPSIVRYGYRSFDRQWAYDDPRWAKTESPSLWWSATPKQIFMASSMTNSLGVGPGATLSTAVPDFHYYAGRGGKDIIPLYRDARGTPNVDIGLLSRVTEAHRKIDVAAPEITPERLFAYTFAILAGTDYTSRWHEELETPGPRIPVSGDPSLFSAMADLGEQLIALQTFGERFAAAPLDTSDIVWHPEPSRLPASKSDIVYDVQTSTLHVADGALSGVSTEVYRFAISGMEVIPKWLSYRMAKASGRSASSKSPLDAIRPESWLPEWSEELREIVGALRGTTKLEPSAIAVLESILDGPLIAASSLPQPPGWMRQPPKSKNDDDALFSSQELS